MDQRSAFEHVQVPDRDQAALRDIMRFAILPAASKPDLSKLRIDATMMDTLFHHRMLSCAAGAVNSTQTSTPQDLAAELTRAKREIVLLQLQLESDLQIVERALTNAGIESRVLKGLATAVLDYPDPSNRHTGDVDLLVRPADFAQACSLIRDLGAVDVKDDQPTHLLVEATFALPSGIEIDLHHRLFRFGEANEHLTFASPENLPSVDALAMSPEMRLVHAAAHLLLAPPDNRRLSGLVDVGLLLRRADVDVERCIEVGREFGVHELVAFAVWLIEAIVNDSPPAQPRRPQSLIGRAYIRTKRRIDLETAAVVADLPTLRDRLDYLRYQITRWTTDRPAGSN